MQHQSQRTEHRTLLHQVWAVGTLLGLTWVLTGCEHPNDAPDDVTHGAPGYTQSSWA